MNGENDYSPLQVMQKLTSEGEVMIVLGTKLKGNANEEELVRVCRIAGWCIQDDEKHRLSMLHIVQNLEGMSEVFTLPNPMLRFLQYIADFSEESHNEHKMNL